MDNKRVLLASRPTGWVSEDNFRVETVPVPQPRDGEVLVKNAYLSLDPYMRGRMNEGKSYAAKQELGEVMIGGMGPNKTLRLAAHYADAVNWFPTGGDGFRVFHPDALRIHSGT